MRAPNLALFLLSLLILYTVSAPVEDNSGVTNLLEAPVFVKSILPGRSSSDHDQARGLMSKEQDIGPDLKKRRGSSGGSRIRAKRPARKRPQKTKEKKKSGRKTKPAEKKPAQSKKKSGIKKPKTPANRNPSTKKPKKQTKACKPAKSAKGKNGKLSARAGEPVDASCPPKKKVTKTRNYRIAEKAAKKAGHKGGLVLGESYLLRFKSKPGLVNHQALIVGTVQRRKANPADGALDFVASSSELVKPLRVPTGRIAKAKQECLKLHGAKCKHRGIERVYDCKQTLDRWGKKSKFIFKGNANPEFADPKKFVQAGKAILEKDTTYDVIYNNCGTHARKLENVAQLKKGQNPLVDIELQDLENLTLEDSE
ncbi:uncharacterized protein CC84DRAFT_1179754 [Paraphaeosphaeria sporulosa]|uniref:Uncharacterized protein n=1 Tax=Paraphaeosphaeria sporulosa TaxID=1460663 RepID=A0A177C4R0_9PLEO|nr:uncharacterized protein CC84DRAFT_1179754 [Paraphaeosphaeria sporulosa]OAG01717.1 hypothetical protein CC84DRAFT_1179754 [Paraphaeosphaeria sporulosa]